MYELREMGKLRGGAVEAGSQMEAGLPVCRAWLLVRADSVCLRASGCVELLSCCPAVAATSHPTVQTHTHQPPHITSDQTAQPATSTIPTPLRSSFSSPFQQSCALDPLVSPSLTVMSSTVKAVAVLRGDAGVSGVITFEQSSSGGNTTIKGKITGLKAGPHGFHVHALGDLSDGCKSAGPRKTPRTHRSTLSLRRQRSTWQFRCSQ